MRVVIQRVSQARVVVDGRVVGEIERGLLTLLGLETSDPSGPDSKLPRKFADKLVHLRVFEDPGGKMNRSVNDLASAGGPAPGLLIVPNFTVAGDASKGRRPSFDGAMRPEHAETVFARIVDAVREAAAPGVRVARGIFRAPMEVTLTNDGPVTIVMHLTADSGPNGL
jgi:D-tyrosyl-tRNA(Tyr) deacylase